MNRDASYPLLIAISLAMGIIVSGEYSFSSLATVVSLISAFLSIIALKFLHRGFPFVVALGLCFFIVGLLRAQYPSIQMLPSTMERWGNVAMQSIGDRLQSGVLSAESESLLSAMMLGQRGGLSSEITSLYRQAGASHILALSGLHLGLLFGVINFCLMHVLQSRWRYVVGLLGLILVWGYALLTAFPVSLCRASAMLSLFIWARMRAVNTNAWHVLSVVAILLLMLSPSMLMDVGFQLSFAAVSGIILFYGPLVALWKPNQSLVRWFWRMWCVSLAAQAFTLPLLLHYFCFFSLTGVIASPVYILLATAILCMGLAFLFLASCSVAPIIAAVLQGLIALQHGVMHAFSSISYNGVEVKPLSWGGLILVYASLLFLLVPLRALRAPYYPIGPSRLSLFLRAWPYWLASVLLCLSASLLG